MPHLTASEWAIGIVLAVVGAFVGYRLSENDRRTLGRTPWGLPSLVWALFWFLSLLLGLVLYLIAHSMEVRRAQHGSPVAYPGPGGAPPVGTRVAPARAMTVAEQFPAYPQPANVKPSRPDREAIPSPESGAPSGPQPAADEPTLPADEPTLPADEPTLPADGPTLPGDADVPPPDWSTSPPAWHPDPSGRFHFRWWDGHQWTSQVSTDGHHLIDTNPDQRIGPY